MHNITAIAFNSVSNSGRSRERDSLGYLATCQDSNNTYVGTKVTFIALQQKKFHPYFFISMRLAPFLFQEPNYFMGPSLYNTDPSYKNLVGRDGGPCIDGDTCYMLHADMLHEAPSCVGIVHDPERITAYGTGTYLALSHLVALLSPCSSHFWTSFYSLPPSALVLTKNKKQSFWGHPLNQFTGRWMGGMENWSASISNNRTAPL